MTRALLALFFTVCVAVPILAVGEGPNEWSPPSAGGGSASIENTLEVLVGDNDGTASGSGISQSGSDFTFPGEITADQVNTTDCTPVLGVTKCPAIITPNTLDAFVDGDVSGSDVIAGFVNGAWSWFVDASAGLMGIASGTLDDFLLVDGSTTAADFAADYEPWIDGTDTNFRHRATGRWTVDNITDFHRVDFDDTAPFGPNTNMNADQQQSNIACLIPIYPGEYGTSGNADGFPIVDGTNLDGFKDGKYGRLEFDMEVTVEVDNVIIPTDVTLCGICEGMSYIAGPSGGFVNGLSTAGEIDWMFTGTPHASWGRDNPGQLPFADPDELVSNGGAFSPWCQLGSVRSASTLRMSMGIPTNTDDYLIGKISHSSWGSVTNGFRILSGWAGAWVISGGIGGGSFVDPILENTDGAGFITGNPVSGANGGSVRPYYYDGDNNCPDSSASCASTFITPRSVDGVHLIGGIQESNEKGNIVFAAGGEVTMTGGDIECASSPEGHNVLVGAGFCTGTTDGDEDEFPCAVDADCIPWQSGGASAASGTCTAPGGNKAPKFDLHSVGVASCANGTRGTNDAFSSIALGPGALGGLVTLRGPWGPTQTGNAATLELVEAHPDATTIVNVTDVAIHAGSDGVIDDFLYGDYWNIVHDRSIEACYQGNDPDPLVASGQCMRPTMAQSSNLLAACANTAVQFPITPPPNGETRRWVIQEALFNPYTTLASTDTDYVWHAAAPVTGTGGSGQQLGTFTVTSYTQNQTDRYYIGNQWTQDDEEGVLLLQVNDGGGARSDVQGQVCMRALPMMVGD